MLLKALESTNHISIAELRMIKKLLPFILFFTVIGVYAQKNKTTEIWGHIRDSFTQASIRDVKVTQMTADGATNPPQYWQEPYGQPSPFGHAAVRKGQSYSPRNVCRNPE